MDYNRYEGHTPGPWTPSNQDTCCVIVDTKDKPIAVINSTDNPEETEANAKLMADAPALLEMCKALEAKCMGLEYMLLTRSLPRPSDKKIPSIKKEYCEDFVKSFKKFEKKERNHG